MTPWRIGLAIVGLALIGLAVILVVAQREPAYGGKTLDQWVHDLNSANFTEQRAAVVALRNLGSEPVPRLRRMLRVRDTAAKRLAQDWCAKVPFLKVRFVPACEQHKIAAEIVGWSGSTNVILDLAALLDDKSCSQAAAEALFRLMPAATASLVRALTNESFAVRWIAAANLGSSPSDLVISNLIAALRERSGVSMVAAVSLGQIRQRADLVVPALCELLKRDSVPSHRVSVAYAIAKFGIEAQPAVPALELLRKDTNAVLAKAVSEALAHIRAAESIESKNEDAAR